VSRDTGALSLPPPPPHKRTTRSVRPFAQSCVKAHCPSYRSAAKVGRCEGPARCDEGFYKSPRRQINSGASRRVRASSEDGFAAHVKSRTPCELFDCSWGDEESCFPWRHPPPATATRSSRSFFFVETFFFLVGKHGARGLGWVTPGGFHSHSGAPRSLRACRADDLFSPGP
jgi:hypothetical protein